jgi:hypothetical protein
MSVLGMPILNVSVSSETKILLDSLSILTQMPSGRVIEVVTSSYVQALPEKEEAVVNNLKRAALARLASTDTAAVEAGRAPAAAYRFSRLCFKRDVVEALGPQDLFRVETPVGTFQMTKADFYRVFPNVVKSRSYAEDGIYHYRKLPSQAEEFRVA